MWDYRIRNDHLDILKGMGLSFFLPFVFLIYDDGDLRLKEIKLALILKINAA